MCIWELGLCNCKDFHHHYSAAEQETINNFVQSLESLAMAAIASGFNLLFVSLSSFCMTGTYNYNDFLNVWIHKFPMKGVIFNHILETSSQFPVCTFLIDFDRIIHHGYEQNWNIQSISLTWYLLNKHQTLGRKFCCVGSSLQLSLYSTF